MKFRLANVVNDSIVDGPGFRLTVFVQGCPHRCPGCHNPQTHDFAGGYPADPDEIVRQVNGDVWELRSLRSQHRRSVEFSVSFI